jgi:RNA polymerase sigma-70 factor (ECF subfamily)
LLKKNQGSFRKEINFFSLFLNQLQSKREKVTDYNSYSEKAVLTAVGNGDKQAFVHLVKYYKDHIYTIALRLTRSTALAEDIVQDIFLKIWLRRNTLSEIHHFASYLNSMVQNTVFTSLKRIALERERLKHLDSAESYLNDNIIHKEYEAVLLQAVSQLPSRQQEVYQLVRGKGLKREEAAQVLNISAETVKYHLAQAVRSIRDYCVTHAGLSVILMMSAFN